MGLHIRDDRQMQAFTGLSPAHCDPRLSVCSDLSQATQQKTYAAGGACGTRRRKPGEGSPGTWPTMVETLLGVLSYYKTYPTFDGLGTPFARVRSQANAHLQKRFPLLDATLVH